MYLKNFKDKLKYVHLKVNPNYKLFKLFGVLWDDLQKEFDKINTKIDNLDISDLKEYINQQITDIRNYIDSEISKVNTRIDNLEIPNLAKNMTVQFYADVQEGRNYLDFAENVQQVITMPYPSNFGIADTLILTTNVVVTGGTNRMIDLSSVGTYEIEQDTTGIRYTITPKINISGVDLMAVLTKS